MTPTERREELARRILDALYHLNPVRFLESLLTFEGNWTDKAVATVAAVLKSPVEDRDEVDATDEQRAQK
jgi:hypothetical protein